MAQQEGPFSEYLQMAKMTPQVQVPQPTGLEGGGAAIGNIAMNFINGLRQGRMQKYAMQQMEEQKKFDAYQDTLQKVRASRLPQAEKNRLEAQLTMPLVQRIAGDKEASSKATGNPLTDVLKNMAVGLVGGNIPKKGTDLPMDPIVEALRMVSDPEKSVDRLASKYNAMANQRMSEIISEAEKTGMPIDMSTFYSDKALEGISREAQSVLGVGFEPDALKRARSYGRVSPLEQQKAKLVSQMLRPPTPPPPMEGEAVRRMIGGPSPAPMEEVREIPKPERAVPTPAQVTTTEVPTEQPVPAGRSLPRSVIDDAVTKTQVLGIPLYKESATAGIFETPSGERLEGKSITVTDPRGQVFTGIYDDRSEKIYSLSELKRLKPEQGTSKEVESAYADIEKSIKSQLKGTDPRIAASFLSQADLARNRKDIAALRKIPDSISDFVKGTVTREQVETARETAATKRAEKQEEREAAKVSRDQKVELTKAHTRYTTSKTHKAFSNMDYQYKSFLSEDLSQGINVEAYLRNPAQYLASKKFKTNAQMQAHLSMMDKSLQRLAAKITDEGSVVRPMEEDGYGKDLQGPLSNLKAKLRAFQEIGSTKATPEVRAELWNLIKSFHRELKNADELAKKEQIQSISAWKIDPDEIKKTFYGDARTYTPRKNTVFDKLGARRSQ